MVANPLTMLRPEQPVLRVLVLAAVLLVLAKGYATIGRVLLRRLMATRHGHRFVPAVCGAGLGVWVAVVWMIFG
jgi:hypothetical protein